MSFITGLGNDFHGRTLKPPPQVWTSGDKWSCVLELSVLNKQSRFLRLQIKKESEQFRQLFLSIYTHIHSHTHIYIIYIYIHIYIYSTVIHFMKLFRDRWVWSNIKSEPDLSSLLYDMVISILKRARVVGWIFLATITRKRPLLTFHYGMLLRGGIHKILTNYLNPDTLQPDGDYFTNRD